jgi:hypothetical protein
MGGTIRSFTQVSSRLKPAALSQIATSNRSHSSTKMSVLKSPLCRLLLFLGSLVLLSLPVHAQLHSLNYDFGWGDSVRIDTFACDGSPYRTSASLQGGEVAQNKTYGIKWSGEGISYMDIYLRYVCIRRVMICVDRTYTSANRPAETTRSIP